MTHFLFSFFFFVLMFFNDFDLILNNFLLQFCTLLAAILFLEIIGGTMGYVMRARVATVAQNKMMNTMSKYKNSSEIQFIWDNLQHDVIIYTITYDLRATWWSHISLNWHGTETDTWFSFYIFRLGCIFVRKFVRKCFMHYIVRAIVMGIKRRRQG